ncbi:MAG: hypothetical protein SGILL_007634, partial [Bacillariaceae sp.]
PLYELLENDEIPPTYIRHLIELYACIPEARNAILESSRRMLMPLYFCAQNNNGSNKPVNDNAVPEDPMLLSRTVTGIHGLLHLMRSDDWDDIQVNAWGILSETLVQETPFLGFESRQELFDTIADAVGEGDMGERTMQHFLRALVVRMSIIVQRPRGSLEREELKAAYRLILALLCNMAADKQAGGDRLASLGQGRDAILRTLLAMREDPSETHDFILQHAKACVANAETSENDSFTLCWATFLVLNFALLDILPERRVHAAPSLKTKSAWGRADLNSLIKRLRSVERKAFAAKSGGNLTSAHLPPWVTSIEHRETTTTSPSEEKGANNASSEDSVPWKMMSGVGYLLRQQLRGEALDEILLDPVTVNKIGRDFLSLAALLAREGFRRDSDMHHADELFFAVEEYCRVVVVVLNDPEDQNTSDVLLDLWDLYNALASEKAAIKIVNYLDGRLLDDASDFAFLNPLKTRSDVNRAIRGLRLCCLDALGAAVSSSSFANAGNENAVIVDVVAGILEALAEDLQKGLDGKSGGISSKMYMSFCSLIQGCSNSVFSHYTSTTLDPTVLSLFDKIACILTGILIEFPLGSAEKFKTTFILGLVSDLMDKTFDDCVAILCRWAQTRDPLSIPWEDIAGLHLKKSPNNSETSVVSLGSHDKRNVRAIDGEKASKGINLIDKEVWSWALSSSIFGLKQIWLDSHSTIRGVLFPDNEMELRVACEFSHWRLFYQCQRNNLRHTLCKVVRFFQAPADSQDQIALDMIAMNMPSYPRDWLCSVIACISQVLTDACQHICQYVKMDTKDEKPLTLPTLESLCCVTAWLSVDSSDDKSLGASVSDFSVGVFKWLEMASRKRPSHATLSARKAETKVLLEKVSSVAEYVYRLYLALKNLEQSLRKSKLDSQFLKAAKVLLAPADGGSQHLQNKSIELLPKVSIKLRLILKVLPREFRERSLPNFPVIRNTAVPMAKGSGILGRAISGSKPGRPGKQAWTSRLSLLTSSKRQRTTAMAQPKRISRNPALEAMWALDQEADNDQDGPETNPGGRGKKRGAYSMYSAAADLEDFITPG